MHTSLYKNLSDVNLTALLKAGDHLAYKEIYKRYSAALYIHAFKRLQDKEECRDIIQDLFMKLWQKHEELNIGDNLCGYLYTAVRNAVFNFLAKSKLKDTYIDSVQQFSTVWDSSADFLTRQNQLITIIGQEIEYLPCRTKEIFKLSRFGNLSHKEIANELQISEQTVKTTINNALKILKVKLGSLFFTFF